MQTNGNEPIVVQISSGGSMPPKLMSEEEQVFADRDWWRQAGEVLDLRLGGWTYRIEAQFFDKETGNSVILPGSVAKRLVAMSEQNAG